MHRKSANVFHVAGNEVAFSLPAPKPSPHSMSEIRHNPSASRFEIRLPQGLAWLDYNLFNGGVVLAHTEVPREAAGEGIGSDLVRAALAWAREEGLVVKPVCGFVRGFLRRHPEEADVVG